jgi:Zinc dependent phospholipase C
VHRVFRLCSVFVLLLALCPVTSAYSVLTHEEVIDLAWDKSIKPLLLARFPNATPDELKEAHAYAYGGAVIQDLGYYPFGSHTFSDLVHYVRSGDFVENLLNESQDLNDYAFALGALAHYASDITGHPAVNIAVGIEFPKLRRRFGKTVTYAEDHPAHLETEFGFDVSQVAKGRYAPQSYHDFIGFKVSKPVLERAFKDTYGIDVTDVIKHEDLALGTYRRSVSTIIPKMTKVAVASREKELRSEIPNYSRKKFLYRLSRSDYEREWGKDYERPGFGARFTAILLKVMPKIGPFRGLAYKNPTPQTEDLYFKSVNSTFDYYTQLLQQVRSKQLNLAQVDLDTGKPTWPGEYSLCDDTYADLVDRLVKQDPNNLDPALRRNVLAFFAGNPAELATKKNAKRWAKLQENLGKLKSAPAVAEVSH